MASNPYYDGPRSDHFDGTRFFNPDHAVTDRSLADLLRWRLHGERARWPEHVASRQVQPQAHVPGVAVTMVGHASVLIQVAGCNVLVDPVWSARASPVGFAGPKRVTAPGIAFDSLPPIHAVLITHTHYDHLDRRTLARLWGRDRPRMVAALGSDAVIRRAVPGTEPEAADWGGHIDLTDGVSVTIHPANHWSARSLRDRRMALWCGFVIRSGDDVIYVAGDTGYGTGAIFRQVRERFGRPVVAIIPIGAYAPRWFMRPQHVDPAEAVRIMLDCGARQALGVHWGTFQLTDEGRLDPIAKLEQACDEAGVPRERFRAMVPGDVWTST